MTEEAVLPGRQFISPALADGLLFLRGESLLLCLDLRKQETSKAVAVAAENDRAKQILVSHP